ncbi:MAG TPA: hypothetical protein VL283_05295 [Candidatus Baltobacteraceae bacterium]|nr:hypothetical protein [Candidatus Baltobacteraceae bacterium]
MGFEFRGPSGDSGRIYEARFLGNAEVDASFAAELEKLPRGERRRFRSDEDVFRLFKEHYKGDPTDPKGIHAKELRGALIDAMDLSEEEFDDLEFYSALGIPVIDHMMGVDGFFEFKDKDGNRRRVTIDVTMKRSKDSPKADVVIGELPDANQEAEDYIRAIDEYAAQIARRLTPPPDKPAVRRKAA